MFFFGKRGGGLLVCATIFDLQVPLVDTLIIHYKRLLSCEWVRCLATLSNRSTLNIAKWPLENGNVPMEPNKNFGIHGMLIVNVSAQRYDTHIPHKHPWNMCPISGERKTDRKGN